MLVLVGAGWNHAVTNLEDTLSVAGQLVMGDTVYEEDGGEIRARPRTLADRTW